MKGKDLLLIALVIIIWGVNFSILKMGLTYTSPFLLGALRYLPFCFILFLFKRPAVSLLFLITYSASFFFLQFAWLFLGIKAGMPAGMSSMVLQSQAFFTVLLALKLLGEPLRLTSVIGLLVAAAGLLVIALQTAGSVPLLGLLFTLLGGFFWAIGNIMVKKRPDIDMNSLTAWGGALAVIPFLVGAVIIDGWEIIFTTWQQSDGLFLFVIFYIFAPATLFGAVVWGKMMQTYRASLVTPFALFIPVVGISSGTLLLNEPLSRADIFGAILVILGLAVNIMGKPVDHYLNKLLKDKQQ